MEKKYYYMFETDAANIYFSSKYGNPDAISLTLVQKDPEFAIKRKETKMGLELEIRLASESKNLN